MASSSSSVLSFLSSFSSEFPAPLDSETPLPIMPCSSRVSEEELQGETLDLGMRLLQERKCPPVLSCLLLQAAVTELNKHDVKEFYCEVEDGQESHVLDSSSVSLCFLNSLINVVLSWLNSPPSLPPCPERIVSVHAIKNTRRKMEDKHSVITDFNLLFGIKDGVDRSLFSVFDGHGGSDSASFAALHLPVILSRQKNLQEEPEEALREAFIQTDAMLEKKAKRERVRGGSTAVTALIQGQRLLLAWLGDSQALLVRNGKEEEVMEAHKPDREDERQRIEDLGGCVTFMGCWRVNGTYAVSRAFGDFDQRPFVSSSPSSSSLSLRGDEDYLLLACDGFFDSISPSSVPGLVLEALRRPRDESSEDADQDPGRDSDPDPERAALSVAHFLVSKAKDEGSSDNITVLVVFLKKPEQILQENQ